MIAHPGREARTQLAEVVGQRKLLKWDGPRPAALLSNIIFVKRRMSDG
jgi:hypothetical protein